MSTHPEPASSTLASSTAHIEALIAEMSMQGGPQVAEAKQAALLLQGLRAAAEDLESRLSNRLQAPPGWVVMGAEARCVGSVAPTWPNPASANLPFGRGACR